MSEPYIAQIMMFGGNFAIRQWAFCDGQLLPIAQNTALFSLVGTTYGGDGRTTFGLPEMRGRTPVHVGNGPGLQPVAWGQRGGSNSNTLVSSNLPAHTHQAAPNAIEGTPNQSDPNGNSFAEANIYISGTPNKTTAPAATGINATQNSPVNNMQPYIGIYHLIALQGIFPSRN